MKVEKQKLESPKQFEPFNLILSVETEEEARALNMKELICPFFKDKNSVWRVLIEDIDIKESKNFRIGDKNGDLKIKVNASGNIYEVNSREISKEDLIELLKKH